ncbi:hypothetical protein [Chitinophaga sancti]|uniref:Uncharacterized protein n=1 Tax=Chitinophaga sancti TaxID=1004 RepID=A0A1K1R1P9_9BACT|nr:hypothetical protein [Chitinophaga sancti]WQD64356.1 hypothetical protein U0033_08105 [Chitinophaga sancti]WQG90020.1 hypothetical protein SR876_00815 [Chitinophaga sancti]SFW66103.1 hypothetical protein SAMN05661012_03284 [Chitinophaga sancti]
MEYKFYETWMFQNEKMQIEENTLSAKKVYFRFFNETSLKCKIGQRCLRGKFGDVYYIGREFEEIWSYHQKNFREVQYFNLVNKVSDRSLICKKYKGDTFIGFLICNCDENYKLKALAKFNENSELLEYREATYTPENTLQKDKIFIPSLWQTFEEDY